MLDVVSWLLAIELLGLLALPVLFVLTPWLPDRGFTITKPIGMLMLAYVLWVAASTSLVPNSLPTLLVILAALAGASIWLWWRHQRRLTEYLRKEWRVILLAEVVFLSVFLLWVVIKSYDGGIIHTEQPMDLAFLNATVVSTEFPPNDPWLAGEKVSYYYFGYLMFGGVTRVAGVATSVGYNLALATIAGMAAVAALGIGMNLVRLTGGRMAGAVATGALGAVLLLGSANLEGGLELLRAGGGGSQEFWDGVDIDGLDGPLQSDSWYPSEPGWWWWRASRVIDTVENGESRDYTITEFPFFSLSLGDLHPHVMSLPFVLSFIALALNFLLAPARLGIRWIRGNYPQFIALAVVLGALAFLNIWDMVTFATLFLAVALVKGYAQERAIGRGMLVGLSVAAPVTVLAVLLYLPFYFSFQSQASGILPVAEYVTRPLHFLIVWGLFILMIMPYLVWELVSVVRGRREKGAKRLVALSAIVALLPWTAWVLAQGVVLWDPAEMVGLAWSRFLHLWPLMTVLAITVLSAIRISFSPSTGPALDKGTIGLERQGLARAFPLVLAAVAVLLLMGPELFRVVDLFNNRMNSMFKLSYQAWTFLALASAYALYYLGSRYGRTGPVLRILSYVWTGALVLGALASFYYPVAATYTKTSGLSGEATLDGLAHVASAAPAEYNGIRWLTENFTPGEIIVEAVGDDYSEYGRVSSSTGIPTVVGWTFHEEQWRGSTKPFEGRREDVQRLYQTLDLDEAREIQSRYGVTYVYVGSRERASYGTDGLGKFEAPGYDEVFREGNVVIYRVAG